MKRKHKYSFVFVLLTIAIFLLNISEANAALSVISPIKTKTPIMNPVITPIPTPIPSPIPTPIPIITPIKTPEIPKSPLFPIKPAKPGNTIFKPINPDILVKIPPTKTPDPGTKTPESIKINLTATADKGVVVLKWVTTGGIDQISSYYVFKGTSSGEENAAPINSEGINGTSYNDSSVTNGTFYNSLTSSARGTNYYVVVPLLKDGTWGTVSNEVYITLSSTIVLQIGNPVIYVNGEQRYVDPNNRNVTPIIIKNRTLLPIRAIIEALGGTVEWDSGEQKVTVELNNTTVNLWIGRTTAIVNGIRKSLDVAPQIINGRTLLPLRFVAENLNCDVNWNGDNQSVTITQG